MPITWLDILLLGVMLISGLLAMIRGFMREVLSIASWATAAIVTLLLYNKLLPIAQANIGSDFVAKAAVIGGVFLVTLLVVSLVTMRVSDMILDSRIGALDRTLGFLFGLGRGLIIVVVAFLFFAWLVKPESQPDGVRNAKSLEVLKATGDWLQALLPQDIDAYIRKYSPGRSRGTEPEPQPQGGPPPEQRSDRGAPEVTGSVQAQTGYQRADRTDMRQLIDATRR
jgi:membrane protein required for colicin V production